MKKIKWAWFPIFIAFALYWAYPAITSADMPPAASNGEDAPDVSSIDTTSPALSESLPEKLSVKVNEWILAISQDPSYASWKAAQWSSYPLGPGIHGWIIMLCQQEQNVGYLVVTATPEGMLKLNEYGPGDPPLYDMETLYQSMMEQGLIENTLSLQQFAGDSFLVKERMYLDPLQAVWRVRLEDQDLFFHAQTGEMLPLNSEDVEFTASVDELLIDDPSYDPEQHPFSIGVPGNERSVSLNYQTAPRFSPFEKWNWIIDEPLKIETFHDFKKAFEDANPVTFAVKTFNDLILSPYAIVGYHLWTYPESATSESFIAVEEAAGSPVVRYIPFQRMTAQGHFYQ